MARLKGYRPSPSHHVGLGRLSSLLLTGDTLRSSVMEPLPTAWDQSWQDCVANAGEIAVRHGQWVQLGRPTAPWPYLFAWPEPGSRAWNYAIARLKAGQSLEEDDGTYISALFDGLKEIGFPKETEYPYGKANLHAKPSWAALRDAVDQTYIAGARRIISTGTTRIRDVQIAIAGGSVVVWGTEIDGAIEKAGPLTVWPGVTEPIVGGHAMLLHGYRTNDNGRVEFSSRSSWGPTFGDNGSVWVDQDAVGSRRASDFWVVESAPLDSGTE